MLTTDILTLVYHVHDVQGRAVSHHNVDSWEVRNRIVGNGYSIRRALVRRVVSVFVPEVWKGPVAELWLL